MSKIANVFARQIFDSRGNPTIEVDLITENGTLGRASVPSGASTGEHEAVEMRDGGLDYMGKGVKNAVKIVNDVISKKLIGLSVFDQKGIDELMIKLDGTMSGSINFKNFASRVGIQCLVLGVCLHTSNIFVKCLAL